MPGRKSTGLLIANVIHLTEVHLNPDGDTYLPAPDPGART